MQPVRIVNKTRESVLGSRVAIADRWWHRARGLLGRGRQNTGDGLLLSPCRAVHTIGIRYPLDIIFLDSHGEVVALYSGLKPRRVTRFHRRAEYALELPDGTIAASGTVLSDQLVWTSGHDARSVFARPHGEASINEGAKA